MGECLLERAPRTCSPPRCKWSRSKVEYVGLAAVARSRQVPAVGGRRDLAICGFAVALVDRGERAGVVLNLRATAAQRADSDSALAYVAERVGEWPRPAPRRTGGTPRARAGIIPHPSPPEIGFDDKHHGGPRDRQRSRAVRGSGESPGPTPCSHMLPDHCRLLDPAP